MRPKNQIKHTQVGELVQVQQLSHASHENVVAATCLNTFIRKYVERYANGKNEKGSQFDETLSCIEWELTGSNRRPSACKAEIFFLPIFLFVYTILINIRLSI